MPIAARTTIRPKPARSFGVFLRQIRNAAKAAIRNAALVMAFNGSDQNSGPTRSQ